VITAAQIDQVAGIFSKAVAAAVASL